MTLTMSYQRPVHNPVKRMRRNATAVMAGAFDVKPARDVLTSLLNVPAHQTEEMNKEERLARKQEKREKREREKERKRLKVAENAGKADSATPGPSANGLRLIQAPSSAPSHLYASRPTIQFTTCSRERSESVTPPSPPLLPSSPYSTPGPSNSSDTSRTSSKRPRTPNDDEELLHIPLAEPRVRKKRPAARKGWKGWVEGSPPPSEKLINLDAVPVLQERRTRSGKNFDAIGVGKDGWV
ncbi:hypothetical protein EV361DRAFT_251154 [Lentinula raphanica]|uniref:Uncharacterized protein n=1 Tax=Lentinula raphanica TaxID=153919 RepID=A0AA38UEW0_9AGAR|nr:hypothetical protein C8R42DRAFT_694334 [Lentinula raphanica]KAJ3761573.1 hypothetical protein EV360DRAFT_92949 [Lentinula raphanica]KAJ3767950.1 hypothetical protein FB446DRAFT_753329 [Lentinula raphanica]KAJ3822610.1 hypothetical protein F5880DRAFT_1624143 [Lentinula raphanica]KAJ3839157.1 hypothetical protein F5878DRAFT_617409 [Lentinula raphanica]